MDRIDILQKIVNKKMKIKDGAQILGISPDHTGRLCAKLREGGPKALILKEKPGRPSFNPLKKEEILGLMRENYGDFGPTFAAEKLEEVHGLKVSRESLRRWMIESGLWTAKATKKARIHQSRERRPCFGELVQIDGSHHAWFEERGEKCCLLVFIDDATGRIIHLRFEETETAFGYMRCVKEHVETFGRPVSYYSDRHSIFLTTRDENKLYQDTQFKAALSALNIALICARSPQAKGRVERCNQTLQDRLVKEMRLEEISSIEQANKFVPQFIEKFNKKFTTKPASCVDAHRPLVQTKEELELVFITSTDRKVSKNLEVRWNQQILQIQNEGQGRCLQQSGVQVCQLLNGEIRILLKGRSLAYKILQRQTPQLIADEKELNGMLEGLLTQKAA